MKVCTAEWLERKESVTLVGITLNLNKWSLKGTVNKASENVCSNNMSDVGATGDPERGGGA